MKLTIKQIIRLQSLIQFSGVNAQGQPVKRTFSNKEFCDLRWFWKNSEDLINEYKKILEVKKEEHQTKILKKNKDLPKPLLTEKVNKALEADPELNKEFSETLKEIEVKPKTLACLKNVLSEAEFTTDDMVLADIIEELSNE